MAGTATKELLMICGYFSPNLAKEEYERKLDETMEFCRTLKEEFVIAGDMNAKSPQWGSPISDARGEYLADWFAGMDIVVHNTGGTPTFRRGDSFSFIDVTGTQKVEGLRYRDLERPRAHILRAG